eukprot:COSAG02_NODE_1437_length_12606_cov_5.043336_6_plen_94_part_00
MLLSEKGEGGGRKELLEALSSRHACWLTRRRRAAAGAGTHRPAARAPPAALSTHTARAAGAAYLRGTTHENSRIDSGGAMSCMRSVLELSTVL